MRRLPFILLLIAAACGDEAPEPPAIASGIFGALGDPLPSATAEQNAAFERGRDVAKRVFSKADGLGPGFNLTSCAGCHEKPVIGGSAGRYRNFLLVGQANPDGSFVATGVNGIQQQFEPDGAVRKPDAADTNVVATRNPIPFFGTGLLAEISGSEIQKRADPDDIDGDGISGRVNFDRGFVGRFGRKAQTVSIEGFIRGPLFNHLGLTSNPLSDEDKARLPVPSVAAGAQGLSSGDYRTVSKGQAAAPDEPTIDDDDVADPELSSADLFDLVSFAMLLAAPQPEAPTARTQRGNQAFNDAGCAACHVEALLSPRGLVPLYSDLLLHDMGDALADGIVANDATGNEFRTQPLWGVSAVGPYLHDGRSDTLDDAIRQHSGEAAASRDRYVALDDAARADIIAFIESLGGASQRTEGLLAPGAPLPDAGAYGGPLPGLDAGQLEMFRRGRAIYDRDFTLADGIGPAFNGDACRACHFDPVIGGAGPADVDVTRHGIIDTSSTTRFREPSIGTMAHRFLVRSDARPPFDSEANIVEARQTPHTFGLGLIDRIAEADILAREDPTDADADGIRGLARRLDDGSIGRFGWKAGVPSVHEFARDAMFNELGVTLPVESGRTFGESTDADDTPDPEITQSDLADLVFFIENLAAPPRERTEPAAEDRGEQLFAVVGCDACHVPSMTTDDGMDVPLYSDLLLHDVQPADFVGIEDGDATMRHFRTAPLWGLGRSAPYMHDGRAWSIEEAVARHESEATAARDAFMNLDGIGRGDLLAFLRSL